MVNEEVFELKVGSKTSARLLAGSIVAEINKHGKVDIKYIGAGSGNVVVKALAIARGKASTRGADLWSHSTFCDIPMKDGEEDKVGIKITVVDMNARNKAQF